MKSKLINTIYKQLKRNKELEVSKGCFSDGSGCWILVEPSYHNGTFYSYEIGFSADGMIVEEVRFFEITERIEFDTKELKIIQ